MRINSNISNCVTVFIILMCNVMITGRADYETHHYIERVVVWTQERIQFYIENTARRCAVRSLTGEEPSDRRHAQHRHPPDNNRFHQFW